MEVKCVVKDRPPILIHPPQEAVWVSAGFEVFPSLLPVLVSFLDAPALLEP